VITNGTPLAFCIANHFFWRSSVRLRLNFFCSSFVSGRLLITFNPPPFTAFASVNDNISRIIDVKGDTTVEFTVPYVYETDFAESWFPQDTDGAFTGPGNICVAIYNPIVSANATDDAQIDMVVWAAAGPDAQFSLISPNVIHAFGYNPASGATLSMKRQCDVSQAFSRPFDSIISGCSYLTDNHIVTSEVSGALVSNLKRYQYISAGPTTPGASTDLPPTYSTSGGAGNMGKIIADMFLFHRGGVSFKYYPISPNKTSFLNAGIIQTGGTDADGAPFVRAGRSEDEIDVSIPWYGRIPYYIRNYSGPYGNPILPTGFVNSEDPAVTNFQLFSAVRDDYQFGFLLPAPGAILSTEERRPLRRSGTVVRPRVKTIK